MPNGGSRTYTSKGSYGVCTSAKKGANHSFMQTTDSVAKKTLKVHRLVCEAFHGPPPFDGAVVIHLDEDSHNNDPANLKWGTQKENLNMPMVKAYHSEVVRQKIKRMA